MKRPTEFEHSDSESGGDNSDEDQVGAHFACRFSNCDKRFDVLRTLKEHDRTHSNIKPYRCRFEPSCAYESAQKGNVFQHVRRMHYNLPVTILKQEEMGIVDNRDAYDHVETNEMLLEEEDRQIRAWLKRTKTQHNVSASSSEVLSPKRDSAQNSRHSGPPSELQSSSNCSVPSTSAVASRPAALHSTDESDTGPAVNCPQPAIEHSQTPNMLVRDTYICPFENCPKSFKYFCDFREHYRTHSHVKPYRCKYSPGNCSYEACTFRFVRRHIRKHHFNGKGDNGKIIDKFVETVQRRLVEEEQFLRARLNLPSTSRQTNEEVQVAGGEDQNRSRRYVNDALKEFACRFCDKRFLGRSAAIRHVQLVHFHIPRIELIGHSKERDEAQRFVVEWHPNLRLDEREGGSSTPDLSGIDTDWEEEMQTEEVAQNVADAGEGDLMAGESPEVNEQIPEQPEGGQADLEGEQGAQQEEDYDSDVVLISSPETSSRSSPELIVLDSD